MKPRKIARDALAMGRDPWKSMACACDAIHGIIDDWRLKQLQTTEPYRGDRQVHRHCDRVFSRWASPRLAELLLNSPGQAALT
jgi:hypothetical protein